MNVDIEILREELFKSNALSHKIRTQLDIAIKGLELLYSGGEQTGIAKKTLEAIKELDLPRESQEEKEIE